MNTVDTNTFWKNYEKWQEEAKEEFENGVFYEESMGSDFEITESGDVHLGNLFHVIQGAVTAWKDSKYFTE